MEYSEGPHIKFMFTFVVKGKKRRVTIKCRRMDCYPGAVVVNYKEITEKLGRGTTSEENVAICEQMHRKVYEYVH